MIEAVVHTLQKYPELAIFLTLAVGYWLGNFKVGNFSLGAVTGVLLTGVIVGQLHIVIPGTVKTVFFLMFLFAVGYSVGPQFLGGLRREGLPQALFAAIVAFLCLIVPYAAARISGMDIGYAAGLLSGANTISAVIGVATDAVNQLGLPPDRAQELTNHIPVAYAVTYIFGTIGTAWFLAFLGPWLLRVDIAAECQALERRMSGEVPPEPGVMSAWRRFEGRTYRVGKALAGKTVAEVETSFLPDARVFIEGFRRGDRIDVSHPDTALHEGDVIVLGGRRDVIIGAAERLGVEVEDRALLDVPVTMLDVVLTNKRMVNRTLADLSQEHAARGVFLRSIRRAGQELPVFPTTALQRGDLLTLVGAKRHVDAAAAEIGYADRPTNATDMVFVGFGIVAGGLLGALTVKIAGVPLSLSTSGGVLIAGLIFGWLRSVHRTFGRIPDPALWMLNSVGLNTFIAVVGIGAGPSFVAGVEELGIALFLWGIVSSLLPMAIGLLLGKYVFAMHPGILLGACAGARTTTAALGMIQDVAKSKVPALGYTVTYAVGNTLLTIWGLVIVMLLA